MIINSYFHQFFVFRLNGKQKRSVSKALRKNAVCFIPLNLILMEELRSANEMTTRARNRVNTKRRKTGNGSWSTFFFQLSVLDWSRQNIWQKMEPCFKLLTCLIYTKFLNDAEEKCGENSPKREQKKTSLDLWCFVKLKIMGNESDIWDTRTVYIIFLFWRSGIKICLWNNINILIYLNKTIFASDSKLVTRMPAVHRERKSNMAAYIVDVWCYDAQ